MIAGSEHESEGGSKEPIRLEDFVSRPEHAEAVDLTNPQKVAPQNRNRWKKPLEIGLVLILAAGVGGAALKMNQDVQAQKDTEFAAAKATAQAETQQISARATEFAAFPTTTPTAEPTATAQPSPTAEKPIPTATVKPETTKAYWSEQQIAQAQSEALNKGKVLLLDTWSTYGGKIEKTKTYNGQNNLVVKDMPKDSEFGATMGGTVDLVGVTTGANFKIKRVFVTTANGTQIQYAFNYNDEILVKKGDQINPGHPLAKLSGEELPRGTQLSNLGQISIAEDKSYNLSENDVLTAETNGTKAVVQIPPPSK